MPGTLLVSTPEHSWRTWRRDHVAGRGLIVLDPAFSESGPACRIQLIKEERAAGWRFLGTLDAQKNPLGVLSALAALLPAAGPDPVIQLFPLRPTPVMVQLALACAQLAAPGAILCPAGSGLDRLPWPVGAEAAECDKPLPKVVKEAQRRANWIDLNDQGERHEIDWTLTGLQGSRLGSGRPLLPHRPGMWAEVQGAGLVVLSSQTLDDKEAADLLDDAGAERMILLDPCAFTGLVCSLAHQDGADFAMGFVESVDVERRRVIVKSPAPAPAPARLLKLGLLPIDANGLELPELKPWSI